MNSKRLVRLLVLKGMVGQELDSAIDAKEPERYLDTLLATDAALAVRIAQEQGRGRDGKVAETRTDAKTPPQGAGESD